METPGTDLRGAVRNVRLEAVERGRRDAGPLADDWGHEARIETLFGLRKVEAREVQ